MNRRVALVLAGIMVCSLFAMPALAESSPGGAADAATGQQQAPPQEDPGAEGTADEFEDVEDVGYDGIGEQLAALGDVDPTANSTEVSEERRDAAAAGAAAGADLAQEQGVEVSQRQRQAAVDAAVTAAAQQQNVSVEQVQAAAQGAAHGALVQSQTVNVTQVQYAVYGGAAGTLSQAQTVEVSQLQAAAYGGTHGALAQRQRVNVTQIQYAAIGATAGGAHGVGQAGNVTTSQLREATQGGAYGSLTQVQNVSVTQVQAAAFGAAGGGAENARTADPKKIQEGSMGGAKGAVEHLQRVRVEQRQRTEGEQAQRVGVEQVQAAARGATKGALTQVQRVSVTQIQKAATGAAKGALTQYQQATVLQIQSAATGSASGVLSQVQQVEVVQIQQVAVGAASGAVETAVQEQIVDVRQIQAAAAGAGQGGVAQIQRVDVRQIQTITASAASGALRQYQEASVTQIQYAARGACEGAISLTQITQVTITQIQVITRQAASQTAATAAEYDIENPESIATDARSLAEQRDEPDDELRGLFFSTAEDSVFLANPNDVAVTVRLTTAEDVQTESLSPGEARTLDLSPANYTATAETEDGESVEIAGQDRVTFSVGAELQSLTATVEDRQVTVANPNDQRVTVFVVTEDGLQGTFDVPGNWEVTEELDPGQYTLSADAEDGRAVRINGERADEFTVEQGVVDLGVTVEDGVVSITNPSDSPVTVTATDDAGQETALEVPAESTESRDLEPGTYTLTGEAADREVRFDGQPETTVTVEADDVDLDLTVDDANVSVTNPSDANVTVTTTGDEEREFAVPAGESVTEAFEPGNYTLAAEADDRTVTLNGRAEFGVEITGPDAGTQLAGLNVTAGQETVSVDNPNEEPVSVTATDEAGGERTIDVPADDSTTVEAEPGTYTLTAESGAGESVPLDGAAELEITVESEPLDDLGVAVDNRTVTVDNPNDETVVVTARGDPGEQTVEVQPNDTATQELAPGNYTLTAATVDGDLVQLDGQDELSVSIAEPMPELESLTVAVTQQTVTIDNPNEEPVTVTASADGDADRTVDVPAEDNVTETFAPGNYTLTAESEAGESVPLDGEGELSVSIEAETEPEAGEPGPGAEAPEPEPGAEEPGLERELDSCTAIDEPGEYELTTDLTAEDAGEACLDVQVSDVVIQGNGNAVSSTGDAGVGVRVAHPDEEPMENVTLRDVRASGWETGVQVGVVGDPAATEATVENVTATDNADSGVLLAAADVTRLSNVTATDNGGWGAEIRDSGELSVADLTLDRNDGGLLLADVVVDSDFTDVNATDNAGPGVSSQVDAYENSFTGLEVADNGGSGVEFTDSQESVIADSLVENNGEQGVVLAGASTDLSLRNLTVRGHTGAEVLTETAAYDGTELTVDPAGTFEFTAEPVTLDAVEQGDLPELPPEAEAVGAGADVTGVEQRVSLSVDLGDVPTDGTVELWRYDGTEWAPVEGAATEDPSAGLQADLTQDGLYAPVVVDEPPELAGLNVTVEDRNVTLDNPNDEVVAVTATGEDGEAQTVDVPANGTVTQQFEAGEHTLTAETADGRPVQLDGQDELTVTIEPPALASLSVSLADQTVTVDNPTGVGVTVTATDGAGESQSFDVPAEGETSEEFGPGEYTLTAEAEDGRTVEVNGESELALTVEALSVETSVDGQNVTLENPNAGAVDVTLTDEGGDEQVTSIPAGESVTVTRDPGVYTLTAQTPAGFPVPVDGQNQASITVETPATPSPEPEPTEPAEPESAPGPDVTEPEAPNGTEEAPAGDTDEEMAPGAPGNETGDTVGEPGDAGEEPPEEGEEATPGEASPAAEPTDTDGGPADTGEASDATEEQGDAGGEPGDTETGDEPADTEDTGGADQPTPT